jgi:thioredoxin 1
MGTNTTNPDNKLLQLIQGENPLLIDFTAAWCGPCKMMPPILHEVKIAMGEAVTIIKIDIDKNPQTAAGFKIQSVPTLLLFKKGKMLWRQAGVVPAQQLLQTLKQFL